MKARLALALAVGGLLAMACTGDRQPDPVGPSFSGVPPQLDLTKQIVGKIDALFPRPILKPLALAKFAVIAIKQARHETTAAQALTLQFVDWALKLYRAHRLIGDQSAATQANLSALIALLYEFVDFAPPTIPPGALTEDGAAVVVGPLGGQVVSPNKQSGVDIPAGALSQSVLVTIARTDNQESPLPTSLAQFPPFYNFTTSPAVPQFGTEVVVGICVTDPAPPDLRLAHPAPGNPETIEILALAPVPFLDCAPPPPPPGLGARASLRAELAQTGWRGVRDRLIALPFLALAPTPLQASTVVNPGGLGGRTGSFSPFGAVQFDSVLVPYQAPGYRYKVTDAEDSGGGFEQPGFNDAEFSTGTAAFGSGSVPEGQVCPLDGTVQTSWPLNTDLLLRKTFILPGGAGNVKIRVAIDNDVQVFVNGVELTDGFQQHEGCAELDSFEFTVPASAVHTGTNVVAVRARDRGVISFVDLKVTAQLVN